MSFGMFCEELKYHVYLCTNANSAAAVAIESIFAT